MGGEGRKGGEGMGRHRDRVTEGERHGFVTTFFTRLYQPFLLHVDRRNASSFF